MDRQRPAQRPTESGPDRAFALRLAGRERCASSPADLVGQPVEIEPPAAMPAGSGSGAADPTNPLRIDSFAAIAATLDTETRKIFEEAVTLLNMLRVDRERVEAKLRETGREDAIRTVTGTSAIDAAIEETEAMIRRLGDLRRGAAAGSSSSDRG